MTHKFLIITISISIFFSCNIKEKSDKDIFVNDITNLEKSVMDTANYTINSKLVKELIGKYKDFAQKFKNDSLTPIFILKAADLSVSINNYNNAIELYESINFKYPKFEKAPIALFLEAMVYADYLKNDLLAKKKYEEFIAKYPNHQLVNDAKKSIEFLGKSPEEILQLIQQPDSLTANIK